jgi:hypothetical protein
MRPNRTAGLDAESKKIANNFTHCIGCEGYPYIRIILTVAESGLGNLKHPVARVVLMKTPTRFAVTVDEHMLIKYTRYKYYDMPQGMELPFEWNDWDADARYEWINENCNFRTMEDHAEEYDTECVHDYGTDVEYE